MEANCTCTLIKGPKNVIVDTMTPWDGDVILAGLAQHGLTPVRALSFLFPGVNFINILRVHFLHESLFKAKL